MPNVSHAQRSQPVSHAIPPSIDTLFLLTMIAFVLMDIMRTVPLSYAQFVITPVKHAAAPQVVLLVWQEGQFLLEVGFAYA